jgi:release factor glutamine methyltransferase
MMDKGRSGPYKINVANLSVIVLPNVYAPGFFTDTAWFAEQLPLIVGSKSLLEIGTGTGTIAISCAQKGAKIVATDVNPDAVVNARLNFAKYNLDVKVKQGSLYESLMPDEKFDLVFWAHPFNNWDSPVHDILLRSGIDHNYDGLKGYIAGARTILDQAVDCY